jgi:hypothetical protein
MEKFLIVLKLSEMTGITPENDLGICYVSFVFDEILIESIKIQKRLFLFIL